MWAKQAVNLRTAGESMADSGELIIELLRQRAQRGRAGKLEPG
jgi:hypothetical protein